MLRNFLVLVFVFSLTFVLADSCTPNITLLNQDPYPAVPGDYVKLVFQINDISSTECNDITFKLLPNYPLIFDPGESGVRTFSKVDYLKDYNSNILVPYKVRIDENAVNGETPVETRLQNKGGFLISKSFDLEIKDIKTDFDVFVDEYDYDTNIMTLQILNVGDSDVEALTVEIPKQDNIIIKGSNKVIVGDLDSNEYTTADFEASPSDGVFSVNLIYSDETNTRRTSSQQVEFDGSYFQDRLSTQKKTSAWTYIFWIIVLAVIIYFVYRYVKKRKARR